jgi:hypothetical protein
MAYDGERRHVSTRRFMVTLVAGTALVLAAPAAIAELPTAAPPDRPEPAAHGSTPPAAAPGPKPHAGAPRPDPSAARPDPPERPTTPPALTRRPHPTAAPKPELPPEPITAPGPETSPHPGAGPTPEPPPQPGAGPTPEPPPQLGAGPTPQPPPQPGTGPTPEPPPEDATAPTPEAAQGPPAGPSPPPGNGQAGCFLTSAALICPGNPDCVITSSGVNCASGCIVTSAGLSCPGGGEVLPAAPVSGGRDETRRPTPVGQVRAERKAKAERKAEAERNVSPTTISRGEETTAQDLPFTGSPMPAWLVLGFALLAGGLLLRRRISSPGTALDLSSDGKSLAVLPGRPPRAGRLPSRRALVLPSLGLVACGMLLIRRMRR